MSSEQPKTKLEALEEKRADMLKARAKDEADQYEIDLEARIALEEEHGTIAAVKVARHTKGQPTMALIKTPTTAVYKRFRDMVHRAVTAKNQKGQQEATELLAKACWVYPAESGAQSAMLDAFPGLLTQIAVGAAALAEGKQEEAGKD